jgi:receptor protein-tyrosine kinase
LSDVLAGDVPLDSALRRHHTLPLEVLASCGMPPNPSELLESDQAVTLLDDLTLRTDIVLFDAPALLVVSDAAVLAGMVSGVVLVARVPTTRKSQLDLAARSLEAVGKRPLGVVLNGLSRPETRPYSAAPPLTGGELVHQGGVWDG